MHPRPLCGTGGLPLGLSSCVRFSIKHTTERRAGVEPRAALWPSQVQCPKRLLQRQFSAWENPPTPFAVCIPIHAAVSTPVSAAWIFLMSYGSTQLTADVASPWGTSHSACTELT